MPVRSLSSSVLVWPSRHEVVRAARAWAEHDAGRHPELLGLGYFGSFAREDWGVGSDLELDLRPPSPPEQARRVHRTAVGSR